MLASNLSGAECKRTIEQETVLVSTGQRITSAEMMRDRGGVEGQQGARIHCGAGDLICDFTAVENRWERSSGSSE